MAFPADRAMARDYILKKTFDARECFFSADFYYGFSGAVKYKKSAGTFAGDQRNSGSGCGLSD